MRKMRKAYAVILAIAMSASASFLPPVNTSEVYAETTGVALVTEAEVPSELSGWQLIDGKKYYYQNFIILTLILIV